MRVSRLVTVLAAAVLAACTASDEPSRPAPPPFDPATLPRPDLSLVDEERVHAAVARAQEGVLEQPHSARRWAGLGHVLLAHGWDREAAAAYRRAASLDPRELRWAYYLGLSLEDDEPTAAIEAFARATEIPGGYGPAHVHLAELLQREGREEEALAHLQRAVRVQPGNPLTHLRLGQALLDADDLEGASRSLERALELNPQRTEAHAALAQVHLALGDRATAEEHSRSAGERAASLAGQDPLHDAIVNAGASKYWSRFRGDMYRQVGDDARAVRELAWLMTDEERDPITWYDYGNSLRRLGRAVEAIEAYERALAFLGNADAPLEAPRVARIHVNLGTCLAQVGESRRAAGQWRRALEVDPVQVEAAYNLALVLASRSEFDAAVEVVDGVLSRRESPELGDLRQRLETARSTAP